MGFSLDIVKNGGKYKSCIWLRYGIFFENTKIYNCCAARDVFDELDKSPFAENRPVMCDYANDSTVYDKDFFDKLYENKLGYIQKINEETHCECTGCLSIEDKEWAPFTKLELVKVGFSADHMCNCKCVYCNQDHVSKASYSIYEFIKASVDLGYLDNSREDCYENVFSWGGGEPTLMRNFHEIVDKIGFNGDQHFMTTGIIFDEKIAQYMEIAKVGGLVVSVDSGTPETYKKVKGVDQFNRVFENLKKYYARAKYKNRIAIKYIMREDNSSEEEIESFFNAIVDNKLYGVCIYIDSDFYVQGDLSDKVRASIYYMALRTPLVARCRPVFAGNVLKKIRGIDEKMRMSEGFYHRLLLHKIEEKGIDIQKVIQYVREL